MTPFESEAEAVRSRVWISRNLGYDIIEFFEIECLGLGAWARLLMPRGEL